MKYSTALATVRATTAKRDDDQATRRSAKTQGPTICHRAALLLVMTSSNAKTIDHYEHTRYKGPLCGPHDTPLVTHCQTLVRTADPTSLLKRGSGDVKQADSTGVAHAESTGD